MTNAPVPAPLPSWSDMLKTAVLLVWNNKPYVMGVVLAATGVWAFYGHVPDAVWALEAAMTTGSMHSSIKANS